MKKKKKKQYKKLYKKQYKKKFKKKFKKNQKRITKKLKNKKRRRLDKKNKIKSVARKDGGLVVSGHHSDDSGCLGASDWCAPAVSRLNPRTCIGAFSLRTFRIIVR